jgi:dolichyl-phosphate-mannose--protein O-mannosyl transferase
MGKRLTVTALAIGVLSLAFLAAGIGRPPMCIFDEYSYVTGARSLLSGQQDANPEHPPLAKYFIAGSMRLAGDNPFGWRLAGAIFGAFTLVAIFLWTYLLLRDYSIALIATALTLFNNFLFVMSRVAMLDVFYFAFVIWGVLAFTAAILLNVSTVRRRLLLHFSGLLFGLGTACKWNAVVTLAAITVAALFFYFRNSYHVREIGMPTVAISLLVVPSAAYILSYWPLCHRFHLPFTAQELTALNAFIWRYHVNCPGNPGLDVPWYRWFFRATPERALSYLMGNFVVIWGGLVGLLYCSWRLVRNFALAEGMVVALYAVNLLQWVIIPQKRLVYYYYYPPAMFLGVAIAIVLFRTQMPRVFGVRISVLLLAAAIVFFVYCYPRMMSLEAPYDCMFGCWV